MLKPSLRLLSAEIVRDGVRDMLYRSSAAQRYRTVYLLRT